MSKEAVYAFGREQLGCFIERELGRRWTGRERRRVADVGCGRGYWLDFFAAVGGCEVYGLDRDPARVRAAQARRALVVRGDARELPWACESFDLVSQFVVFTSVPASEDRQRIAQEMRRVLKPRGLILWHDFFVPNPLNPGTRPVGRKEIARLFPDCLIMLRRVTLAAPLAHVSLMFSRRLSKTLDTMPFLHTHYLALIEPKD